MLFLYVDCRLCLSLGAINIYQDQLYILELRKIYLTTPMAVKNPLQSHREKCKKRLRNGKELEEQFFSFSLTNFYHSIFSPTLKFSLFFFAKLNARFSTTMLLHFVESMHIWYRHVALMLWSAGNTWHSVLFDADEGEASTRNKTSPLNRAAKSIKEIS